METFRQAMAFPLLATVAWLAWVLGAQAGNDAVLALLAGLLLLAIAAWIYGRWAHVERAWRYAAPAALAIAGLAVAWPTHIAPPGAVAARRAGELPWQSWSREKVSELRAQGTPVFVDFTAAWCITCQVNKRMALNDAAVVKRFAELGVTPLKADWTNMDPKITAALAELGRNAVPVYVLYSTDRNAAPKLLPEVLTSSLVLDELNRLPAPAVASAEPLTR
jgi:thiol:disulfide interchange protein DsbD